MHFKLAQCTDLYIHLEKSIATPETIRSYVKISKYVESLFAGFTIITLLLHHILRYGQHMLPYTGSDTCNTGTPHWAKDVFQATVFTVRKLRRYCEFSDVIRISGLPNCQLLSDGRLSTCGMRVCPWEPCKLDLVIVRQKLNGQRYLTDILNIVVVPLFDNHPLNTRPIFMDDNARPHRARVVIDFLHQQAVTTLPWPARSPDLNPIEMV